MLVDLTELDIIYISFDEPRCEEFWSDLLNKCPWAKRSHGVIGFDAAHKAAAQLAETERFITVDGDNIVDPSFFDNKLDITPQLAEAQFSWRGRNVLNGLIYGNGGLKCWTRDFVLNMETHENSNCERAAIDFCWERDYVQMEGCYSEVHVCSSPFQAFRSGFREGVKLSLSDGRRLAHFEFKHKIWPVNMKRLLIWMTVGADIPNGIWSIYGARLGCHMVSHTDWDHHLARDYGWFRRFYDDQIAPGFIGDGRHHCLYSRQRWDDRPLLEESVKLGESLRKTLMIEVVDLTPDQSAFFKTTYPDPSRKGIMLEE